jgi:hypothetical protein
VSKAFKYSSALRIIRCGHTIISAVNTIHNFGIVIIASSDDSVFARLTTSYSNPSTLNFSSSSFTG